jgi:hypothetical protein
LWRNTDDPAEPPAVRIGPDDYTPAITFAATLAQHTAMAADFDPWDVLTALFEVDDRDCEDGDAETDDDAGTVVTMTEGYDIWWPPEAHHR